VALMVPGLLFLLCFLVVPVGRLLVASFQNQTAYMQAADGYTLSRYVTLLTTPTYLRDIGVTIGVALLTTVITLLVAYPAANLLATCRNKVLRSVLYVVLVSPLLTSVVVRSFAWVVLLSNNGLVNQVLQFFGLIDQPVTMLWNMGAVIVAYVQVLLPFAVMPLVTSLSEVSSGVRRASACLGAGSVRTFFKVVLPLTVPGAVNGALVVFSLTAGSYITPLLIGGGMQPLLPLDIYQQAMQVSDLRMAAAMAVLLLVIILVIVVPVEIALKRWEERVYG
jgi:putative spermidine/putrescine transport system permease protein